MKTRTRDECGERERNRLRGCRLAALSVCALHACACVRSSRRTASLLCHHKLSNSPFSSHSSRRTFWLLHSRPAVRSPSALLARCRRHVCAVRQRRQRRQGTHQWQCATDATDGCKWILAESCAVSAGTSATERRSHRRLSRAAAASRSRWSVDRRCRRTRPHTCSCSSFLFLPVCSSGTVVRRRRLAHLRRSALHPLHRLPAAPHQSRHEAARVALAPASRRAHVSNQADMAISE